MPCMIGKCCLERIGDNNKSSSTQLRRTAFVFVTIVLFTNYSTIDVSAHCIISRESLLEINATIWQFSATYS